MTTVRDEIEVLIREGFEEIQAIIDNYTERGSGFSVADISDLDIYLARYKPHQGGCSIQKLPGFLADRKCLVTLNCTSDCFMYAVLASLYASGSNTGRCGKYQKYISDHDFSEWKGDVSIKQIAGFEKANPNISVSVYSYNLEEKYVIPVRITKQEREKHIQLLLHSEHYYPIKRLSTLLNSRTSWRRYHCERCLQGFRLPFQLEQHLVDCRNRAVQRVEMPIPKMNKQHGYDPIIVERNYKKETKHPFVIYADFESIVVPTDGNRRVKHHQPSSYGYCVVDWNKRIIKSEFKHGENIINEFLSSIWKTKSWLDDYMNVNIRRKFAITTVEESQFRNAINCWICGDELGDDKVRDHDHLTGKFRGAAHNACNLNYKIPKRIPIYFHNLKNYDAHLIIKGMDAKFFNNKMAIIPQTMEKYVGWFVGDFAFLDSFAYLSASLDTLSKDLSQHEKEQMLRQHWETEDLTDLCGKAVLPYEYLDSLERYQEKELPPIEKFYSSLNDSNITTEMYERLTRIWNQFSCESLGQLIDIYLRLDVYMLAAVFENFRETSICDFGIDPPHYMSVPGLSFSAAIKMLKISLEIFTDLDMYIMIENGIRGGFTTVARRYAKANNPQVEGYDGGDQTWLQYLDVNNLYGYAMVDTLPYGGYKWTFESLETIMATPDDSDIGYILEVDLTCPAELHDAHTIFL